MSVIQRHTVVKLDISYTQPVMFCSNKTDSTEQVISDPQRLDRVRKLWKLCIFRDLRDREGFNFRQIYTGSVCELKREIEREKERESERERINSE